MLEAFGLSDPGCVRANNEDYFIADTASGIFVLADGMGGANAGEYAAHLSAQIIYKFLLAKPSPTTLDTLEQGFNEANHTVREAAKANPDLEGMGTTLLVARTIDGGCQLQIGPMSCASTPAPSAFQVKIRFFFAPTACTASSTKISCERLLIPRNLSMRNATTLSTPLRKRAVPIT